MATVFYGAMSLDGFLATPQDTIEFLDTQPAPEPSTYEPFIENVGAIVMGSATYEFVLREAKEWPYTQPTWVMTTRDLPRMHDAIRFARGSVADIHDEMVQAAGGKDIWICGGGDLVGQFHDAGLLDGLIVQVASAVLGAGKPVLPRTIMSGLELTSATAHGPGFAELRYSVRKELA